MRVEQILNVTLISTGIVCMLMALGQLLLKGRTLRNAILATMFCSMAVCIFGSSLYYSRLLGSTPHLFMVTIPFLFSCMPLFYLFLKIWATENFAWGREDYAHVAGGPLVAIILAPVYLFPAELKQKLIIARLDPSRFGLEDYFFFAGIIYNLVYSLFFLRITNVARFAGKLRDSVSRVLFVTGQVVIIATLVGLAFGAYWKSAHIDLISMFGLSIALTITYVLMLRHPEFVFELRQVVGNSLKYKKSRIKNLDLQELKNKVDHALSVLKLYHDPDLTLKGLAENIQVKPHALSEYLNKLEKTTYHELLNTCRVREAKEILINEPGEAVFSVGYRVGFPSRSSFNSAFSRICGCSPTAFRRNNLTGQNHLDHQEIAGK